MHIITLYFQAIGMEKFCYLSTLQRDGGSFLEWVKTSSCSTKAEIANELKWFFKKSLNNNGYNIVDFSRNILRINNESGSINRYFAYIAKVNWRDSYSFFESFSIDASAGKIYADSFSENNLILENQINNSYNEVKEFFRKKYFINSSIIE